MFDRLIGLAYNLRGKTRYDPVEKSEKYIAIQGQFEKDIEDYYRKDCIFLPYCCFGSCHTRWAIKKRILKEKYNIDWRTPDELNPGICFD